MLTDTSPASHGAIFFDTPTDFQGTGGFSIKFVLQALVSGSGDAWEMIIAGSSNRGSQSPPFASGQSANGLAGWSRLNSFVVEFDSFNSGSEEQDPDTGSPNHVAMYLAGVQQCKQDVSLDFSDGSKYTVWMDYDGFATKAYVRVSTAGSSTRPDNPTLECTVDIWSTMSISSDNHVGFAAYNPVAQTGAQHALVDLINIADSYRPYDFDDCASYAKCTPKTLASLCVELVSDGQCLVRDCTAGWIWDVAGATCCGFIDRASWVPADSETDFVAGDTVACNQIRRIIAFEASDDKCT